MMDKIMEKINNFKVDKKRFEIMKENYVRGIKKFEDEKK
jgi:hypothetical protein